MNKFDYNQPHMYYTDSEMMNQICKDKALVATAQPMPVSFGNMQIVTRLVIDTLENLIKAGLKPVRISINSDTLDSGEFDTFELKEGIIRYNDFEHIAYGNVVHLHVRNDYSQVMLGIIDNGMTTTDVLLEFDNSNLYKH